MQTHSTAAPARRPALFRKPPVARPARSVGVWLKDWARTAPDRPFLAERPNADGAWRSVTDGATLGAVECLATFLLGQDVSPTRPVVILSGNSIDHALLALAAMHIGVPVATVSPAYLLSSNDHPTRSFERQSDAIDYGRNIARNQGSELHIQGEDVKFREAWSYGNNPFPPKG